MAELIVVRHGQAAFGQENYDQLSDVGFEQARLAGGCFARHGVGAGPFDIRHVGTATRHAVHHGV